MTNEDKKAIMQAAASYMKDKGITQGAFSKLTGVNTSYMSSMVNGVFTYTYAKTGEERDIDNRWFVAIANVIGYPLKKEYWPLVQTEQFVDIAKELTEAKETSMVRILIGETGCGKTFTIDRFLRAYPLGSYKVTCNKNDTINDLIRKIQMALQTNHEGSISNRIDRISMDLSRQADAGHRPILIFDEAEYLSLSGLLSIKTIYDYLKYTCSISMAATPELLDKLERWRKKEGVKQCIRRWKAGIRMIRPIDRTYKHFFDGRGYSKDLCDLLVKNADNYGELADYLEPAIREADKRNVPLTTDFFNSMFYLQKA